MSISERLKALADFEGSQTNLAKKASLTSQVISRTINKGAGLHSDTIIAIAEAYPNLNLQWFITGKGDMWLVDDLEQKVNATSVHDKKEELKDEIIALQKARIKMLEEQIRLKDAEWGKGLGVE